MLACGQWRFAPFFFTFVTLAAQAVDQLVGPSARDLLLLRNKAQGCATLAQLNRPVETLILRVSPSFATCCSTTQRASVRCAPSARWFLFAVRCLVYDNIRLRIARHFATLSSSLILRRILSNMHLEELRSSIAYSPPRDVRFRSSLRSSLHLTSLGGARGGAAPPLPPHTHPLIVSPFISLKKLFVG